MFMIAFLIRNSHAFQSEKDARIILEIILYIDDLEKILPVHTSTVRIRQLAKRTLPLRFVAQGQVYQKDEILMLHIP